MVPKAKKEAPAQVKVKALKAKKAVLEGIHSTKKKIHMSHTFQDPGPCRSGGSRNILKRVHPGETSLATVPSSDSPDHWISHEEGRAAHSCSLWMSRPTSTRSNRLWRNCDIDVAKVNTLLRIDGEKACVQLAPHYGALDMSTTLGSSELSPAG